MFTDWQSPEETHAPQLFRFPLPKSLQLASKSKPMKQVEFEMESMEKPGKGWKGYK